MKTYGKLESPLIYIGTGLKSNVLIRWHLLTSYQNFGNFPKKLDKVKMGKKAF